MFTNEFEFDGSITTILDEDGRHSDVEILIADSGVYIRQFDEEMGQYDMVVMSHKMYYDLIESRNHPEGVYLTKMRK